MRDSKQSLEGMN